ncbi:MAG: 1-deoxy-D-xylulose-5-phosphate synthase [Corynebacterium propinquum]|nr:MAG: 1-deoxy-D-xylulose-5-phosphate synthase [Corynebacterium propinquum]
MGLLRGIRTPADLKALSPEQLPTLAEEIRDFLIEHVSVTGGHLGPNLGVVELTLALHRVFDSPEEPFIFDTSHQSYVHKIVTGRADRFTTLRQKDGLSGYTARAESEHDWTESSHASASLAYADGLSKGFALDGRGKHNVVAVVGDGALTGGMCWEALNNIAAGKDRNVVIVVNDNGRSYSPTIGGFAENLAHLRISGPYDGLMEHGKKTLKSMGWVGNRAFEALHAFKEGVKHTVLPTEMFPELGMKYVGPVDGHDFDALDQAFSYAKNYQGPIIVHVVTEKGHGYEHAVNDEADQMHSTGAIDPVTGLPKSKSKPGWTQVFTKELLAAAEKRSDIVAITAAMAGPTGLAPFAERFPDRFFDVGIAEQHAVASASGLALAGFHPVVAVYSTFLNRAFDQLLFDVALLDQPVTLVLDRAGVTGSDGASHNEALLVDDGPTIVRFPKGSLPPELPVWASLADGVDIMHYSDAEDGSDNVEREKTVLVIAVGSMVETAVIAAQAHENVTVVDPGWVSPVAESLYSLASDHDAVLTVEDGIVRGGIGSLVAEEFSAAGITTPVRHMGFPAVFPLHASRNELLAEVGLDVAGISAAISELRRG